MFTHGFDSAANHAFHVVHVRADNPCHSVASFEDEAMAAANADERNQRVKALAVECRYEVRKREDGRYVGK